MKCFVFLIIFSSQLYAQTRKGDFYQDRRITRRVSGGETLVALCDEQTTTCINKDSLNECERKNEHRTKFRYRSNLFCVKIKNFEDYDACRIAQYKLVHERRDFAGLCNFKKSQDL